MRVYLGGDHAGYEFKKAIIAHLSKAGHEPIDCGAPGSTSRSISRCSMLKCIWQAESGQTA